MVRARDGAVLLPAEETPTFTGAPNRLSPPPTARSTARRWCGSSRGEPDGAKDGCCRRCKMAGPISYEASRPRPNQRAAPSGRVTVSKRTEPPGFGASKSAGESQSWRAGGRSNDSRRGGGKHRPQENYKEENRAVRRSPAAEGHHAKSPTQDGDQLPGAPA